MVLETKNKGEGGKKRGLTLGGREKGIKGKGRAEVDEKWKMIIMRINKGN